MPGSPGEKSVHSGAVAAIRARAAETSCSKVRSSRFGDCRGIALPGQVDGHAHRLHGLRGLDAVIEDYLEAARIIGVGARVDAQHVDTWLPALEGTTDVVNGETGSCVVVGREDHAAQQAAIVRPHHALARRRGKKHQDRLVDRISVLDHVDLTRGRDLQTSGEARSLEVLPQHLGEHEAEGAVARSHQPLDPTSCWPAARTWYWTI